MLKDYGYNDAQTTEIYDIITKSSISIPEKINRRKTALYTALAAAGLLATYAGINHTYKKFSDPTTNSIIQMQPEKYIEQIGKKPVTHHI